MANPDDYRRMQQGAFDAAGAPIPSRYNPAADAPMRGALPEPPQPTPAPPSRVDRALDAVMPSAQTFARPAYGMGEMPAQMARGALAGMPSAWPQPGAASPGYAPSRQGAFDAGGNPVQSRYNPAAAGEDYWNMARGALPARAPSAAAPEAAPGSYLGLPTPRGALRPGEYFAREFPFANDVRESAWRDVTNPALPWGQRAGALAKSALGVPAAIAVDAAQGVWNDVAGGLGALTGAGADIYRGATGNTMPQRPVGGAPAGGGWDAHATPTGPLPGGVPSGGALSTVPAPQGRYDFSTTPERAYPSDPMTFDETGAPVPTYRMGNGALSIRTPQGEASMQVTDANRQRLGALAGRVIGEGSRTPYRTDAEVAAQRPDLYGPDGQPHARDDFGNARNLPLERRVAEEQARTGELQGRRGALPPRPGSDLEAQALAMLDSAGHAKYARTAALRQQGALGLLAAAEQARQGALTGEYHRGALANQAEENAIRRQAAQASAESARHQVIPVSDGEGGQVLWSPTQGYLPRPDQRTGALKKSDRHNLNDFNSLVFKRHRLDDQGMGDPAEAARAGEVQKFGARAYKAMSGTEEAQDLDPATLYEIADHLRSTQPQRHERARALVKQGRLTAAQADLMLTAAGYEPLPKEK